MSETVTASTSESYQDESYKNQDPELWRVLANCLGADPDLFFPERGAGTKEAKAVCSGCEVRDDCLEYALERGEKHGIWGGLSDRERRLIVRYQLANTPYSVVLRGADVKLQRGSQS